MFKKLFYLFLAAIILFAVWNYELVVYGANQAYGQINILLSTKSIEDILTDQSVSDSIKQKIELINEIKQFAFDSLGIKKNKNYTSFYDQKGKPILWVITACPPFEMKAYEWEFPILGSFSYKGYFDKDKAIVEENKLKEEGYDTDMGEVSAWSTLGWLRDPILSSMLRKKPGNLANLIIHELTHGTLYVKNNVEFNENLANFIGDYGARKFMAQKYGLDSKEYLEYENGLQFNIQYSERILGWAKKLDSLYKSFDADLSKDIKSQKKEALIAMAASDLTDFIQKNNTAVSRKGKDIEKLNNAFFIDYITYHSKQNSFEEEFRTKFNSNFPAYMNYLKEKYPGM